MINLTPSEVAALVAKLERIEDAVASRLNAAEIKDEKEEVARALREILDVIRAK